MMANQITAPPAPCFVIDDLSCGGAQTATLRWTTWLPEWVRERTSIVVSQWPRDRWTLADIAAQDRLVAPIVREPPAQATRFVLSFAHPVEGQPGSRHAVVLHGCDAKQSERMTQGIRGADLWPVSHAVARTHRDWAAENGHRIRGILRPPPTTRNAVLAEPEGVEPQRNGRIRVLFRSRMCSEKGAHILATILALEPRIELHVQAGLDPDHADTVRAWQEGAVQKLRDEGKALGVSERLHIGAFTYELNPHSMIAAKPDVLLLPSKAEGHGLVVAEAIRAGIAVACTDAGGLAEFAHDGEDAALFAWSDDAQDLAQRAVRAILRAATLQRGARWIEPEDWAGDGHREHCLPALLEACGASISPGGADARVTVGVRFHVGGRLDWLDQCMGSLAGQTYRDFRTLLCIDGFAEDAARVAARYGVPFVCTDVAPCIANMSRAFRYGLEACRSVWFKPLDFDDRLYPGYLERAVDVAEADGLDLYASRMCIADEDGTVRGEAEWPEAIPIEALASDDVHQNPIPHLSVLLRAEAARKAGNYLMSAPAPGDDDRSLWQRMYSNGCTIWRDSAALVAYRLSPEQSSQAQYRAVTGNATRPTEQRISSALRRNKPPARSASVEPAKILPRMAIADVQSLVQAPPDGADELPRLLLYTERFLPYLAGSELYALTLCRELQAKGWRCAVATQSRHPNGAVVANWSGVRTYHGINPSTRDGLHRVLREWRPAVLLTQSELAEAALLQARDAGIPGVVIAHSPAAVEWLKRYRAKPRLVVVNSKVLYAAAQSLRCPVMAVQPPVDIERATSSTGCPSPENRPNLALVGLSANKGGDILPGIARELPGAFLCAVEGSYGKQLVPRGIANVRVRPNGPIAEVLADTKLLLMPSVSETFGMIGVEAQSQGIPVVATDLPALRDSLGGGAVFAASRTASAFAQAVGEALRRYHELSALALENAQSQAQVHAAQVEQLSAALREIGGIHGRD
jgi:glycosyltransferase involved in cell wall biosynthesis